MLRLALLLLVWLLPQVGSYAADSPPIAAAAAALLAERFPETAHRLDVRVLRTGADVRAGADVRLVLPAQAALPRGRTQVDVLTRAGGAGWTKAGWALLYVAHFDSVVMARAVLDRDAAVTSEDVSVAWVETTTFRGEPLRAAAFRRLCADGAVFAARRIPEGRPLRHDDLRAPLAVDTGGAVRMRYERGPVRLKIACQARERGRPGEMIRLYCPDTRTTYRARLTGPGTADWVQTL